MTPKSLWGQLVQGSASGSFGLWVSMQPDLHIERGKHHLAEPWPLRVSLNLLLVMSSRVGGNDVKSSLLQLVNT